MFILEVMSHAWNAARRQCRCCCHAWCREKRHGEVGTARQHAEACRKGREGHGGTGRHGGRRASSVPTHKGSRHATLLPVQCVSVLLRRYNKAWWRYAYGGGGSGSR